MKLAILTPCGTSIDHEHFACVNALGKGTEIYRTYGATLLEQARSILVANALRSNADVFFWIDSDMVFNPADVAKTAERCLSGPYAVLGAAYSKRGPGRGMVGAPVDVSGKIRFYEPGLIPAKTVGFGFTAVRREVFEKLNETLPEVLLVADNIPVRPYFMSMIDQGLYLGEDVSFCARATAAGFKVGIDKEPRVLHKGQYCYALEDAGLTIPACEVLEIEIEDTTPPPLRTGPARVG